MTTDADATKACGDEVRVTVGIAVSPERAFAIFTTEINRWWRRGRRFRSAPGEAGIVFLEPGPGGRVFESFGPDSGTPVHEMGRTLVWDPPHRLVLEWRAANFAPHEKTEVEVLFRPSAIGTTVVLVHRGWRGIRADHPVRHGLDVPAFCTMMGSWWGDQLTSLRLHSR